MRSSSCSSEMARARISFWDKLSKSRDGIASFSARCRLTANHSCQSSACQPMPGRSAAILRSRVGFPFRDSFTSRASHPESCNTSFWGVLQTWRNRPAVLSSKLRDAIQSRIKSGVKHRGGSAVQKRVCGRSQQNQGSQGTDCRSEQE